MAKAKADMEDEYRAESDARTLTSAQEIQGDAGRHKKAVGHLHKQAKTAKAAHEAARRHMLSKTKKGLAKAFPSK